ncbi:MAG: S8 family serine peptidase, partial [Candidatus Dormibacteria bacterium]
MALLLAAGSALAVPLTTSAAAETTGPLTTVIVRGDGGTSPATLASDITANGGQVKAMIETLDGAVATVPANEIAALSRAPGIAEVTPDSKLTLSSIGGYEPASDAASLYNTAQEAGAAGAWSKGYTGKGVGVALIDTGVSPVQGLNNPGQVFNGPDVSFDSQAPQLTYLDEYGHGTHLAGIIAGNDYPESPYSYASDTTHFYGIAPDAHIINVKVGDENGVVDVSQVLAAIDWVVQHRNDAQMNIRVINLSFGTYSGEAYTLDPLAYASEVAWRNGITVVAAAGNGGKDGGLEDPAYDPFLLAVGAVDTQGTVNQGDDTAASFTAIGNGVRNPDIAAPGVHIASLRDPGSYIDQTYGSTGTVSANTRFFRGSGTSQAAAVVSGVAALFYQAWPNATPDQLKAALMSKAANLPHLVGTAVGAGMVSAAKAINVSSLPTATQNFTPSTGGGTLEATRGGVHVMSNGSALQGEQDIFGNAFNSTSMAALEANGASWSGGTWNGASWSGASWSGASWSGASWSGASWSGASWSGASWSGASWSGASW